MNKRHYEHTLPNIRGSLSNTYRDSLIVSVLAYNVGCSRIKGYGKIPKSRLLKKLESGDRDIYKEYVSFRCYKGKVVPSIERRRKVEYMLLFEK